MTQGWHTVPEPEVVIEPAQFMGQNLGMMEDRGVHIAGQPRLHCSQEFIAALDARLGCKACLLYPLSHVVGEPKEVECIACLRLPFDFISLCCFSELDELRLVCRQLQVECCKPLGHLLQEPLRFILELETHNEIVGVPDYFGFSPEAFPESALEPQVEHIMQVDVRQKRADRSALRRSFFAPECCSFVHVSGVQPLLDQPQDSRISHPMGQKLHQPVVVDRIEVGLDVCFDNIVRPSMITCPPEFGDCVMA